MHGRDELLHALQAHYAALRDFVRRRVRCGETATEIVHDTYVRLALLNPTRRVENPIGFLYRVVGNLAIDHLRAAGAQARQSAGGRALDSIPDERGGGDARAVSREQLACIARALEELPPRCREVFVLRKVEHLEQEEIAARLGISVNMVGKHLRKALIHFQTRLRGEA
jgi:RNA polymerase sigma-70 factor (ECF subfamily)